MNPADSAAPIDCTSAGRLVDAFLVDELDATSNAALQAHLAGCANCSVEFHGFLSLVELLATLPEPVASPELDRRLILAAIADRHRRDEHRSWLGDLPRVVFRGAMRTTGTLLVTLATVALIGVAVVFAAGSLLSGTALFPTPSGTVAPEVTPTLTPQPETPVPTNPPTGTPRPVVVSATPAPTPVPTVEITSAPEPTATAEPVITPAPTAQPTPEPTATPTEKPRRTPPPQPTDTPAPTADVTPSP